MIVVDTNVVAYLLLEGPPRCPGGSVTARTGRAGGGERLRAYDCAFVAAALALQTRLISSDRQLLRAFPEITTPLEQAVP